MTIQEAHIAILKILFRVEELGKLLENQQLTVQQHLDLQEELMCLRVRLERLRYETLGGPLAAICTAEEDS